MLVTAGLSVVYGESYGTPQPLDDCGCGWRVRIDACNCVMPIKFLRERDATVAMHTIAGFIDWNLEEAILDAALHSRRDELRRLMTENLAW